MAWYLFLHVGTLSAFKTKNMSCLQQQGKVEEGSHREESKRSADLGRLLYLPVSCLSYYPAGLAH